MGDFDRIKGLGQIPSSHAGRWRFHPAADRSIISTIKAGVLFVMAFWSGTSRRGFASLKSTLEMIDPNGLLELVIVDTDGCPDLYETPELKGLLHGNGEVAWIREGRIICTSGIGLNPECFESNTRSLLEMI